MEVSISGFVIWSVRRCFIFRQGFSLSFFKFRFFPSFVLIFRGRGRSGLFLAPTVLAPKFDEVSEFRGFRAKKLFFEQRPAIFLDRLFEIELELETCHTLGRSACELLYL